MFEKVKILHSYFTSGARLASAFTTQIIKRYAICLILVHINCIIKASTKNQSYSFNSLDNGQFPFDAFKISRNGLYALKMHTIFND